MDRNEIGRIQLDHQCVHPNLDVDLANIAKDIQHIKDSQTRTEEYLEKIDNTVFGNGKEGHTTKIARNRDAIVRQWYALGVIITGLSGLAFWSLRG